MSKGESNKQGPLGNWKAFSENSNRWQSRGRSRVFFNNIRNADKLGGLVEDIRDAAMDYQVRNQREVISLSSDIRFRLRYNKISTTQTVN